MTSADLDLAVALLALRRGKVSPDSWGKEAETWSGDPAASLVERLVGAGLLTPEDRNALLAELQDAASASTRTAGSRAAATRMAGGVRAEVVAEPPDARFALEPGDRPTGPGVREAVAFDASLGRRVLLRLVAADAEPQIRQRVKAGATLLARLEHPGILPVHDMGTLTSTGEDYISLRLVEGPTLQDALSAGQLDPRRSLEVLRDVARALAFVHAHGVEHGAVEAANVVVGARGEALLVGWDGAREISPELDAEGHDVAGLKRLLGVILRATESADPVLGDLTRPGGGGRSAAAIAAELDRTLEGDRERERRRKAADEAVARAVEALARRQKALMDAETLEERARDELKGVRTWDPVERKRAGWRLEDDADAARAQAAAAHADTEAALQEAVEAVTGHAEARRMLASLAFGKFLEAEASGNQAQAILHARQVAEYDDGPLAARRRGEGRLGLVTAVFRCDCLRQGREVRPDELIVGGRHLVSGRRIGHPEVPFVPEVEPAQPFRRRVHSAACTAVPLAGADVWAFRFDEIERLLVPATPVPSNRPVPETLLDALYGRSPYRPRGGGIWLGRTPIEPRPWPMGSWVLIVAAEGRAPVRVPVNMKREGEALLEVTLFAPEEIPPGFVHVPAGAALLGGGSREGRTPRPVWIDDCFFAARPVSVGEVACMSGSALHTDTEATATGEGVPCTVRDWGEAVRIAAAVSERVGWLTTLPGADQREKASRGVDGREYPWGPRGDPSFAVTEAAFRENPRPLPSGSHPADTSVYGLVDIAGNTADWCLEDCAPQHPDWKQVRGSMFDRPLLGSRCEVGLMYLHSVEGKGVGVRLVAPVRLPPRLSP